MTNQSIYICTECDTHNVVQNTDTVNTNCCNCNAKQIVVSESVDSINGLVAKHTTHHKSWFKKAMDHYKNGEQEHGDKAGAISNLHHALTKNTKNKKKVSHIKKLIHINTNSYHKQ